MPAFGLDYALGDCLAAVVARGRQPAREVLVAYAIEGADVSANSLKFAGQAPLGHEVLFESGAWRKPRTEIYRRTVDVSRSLRAAAHGAARRGRDCHGPQARSNG